jgi:hypothetical protein
VYLMLPSLLERRFKPGADTVGGEFEAISKK